MFNAFLSPRAVPATPEERLGASTEHLPEACGLRLLCRGSASSLFSRGYVWVRCALRPAVSQLPTCRPTTSWLRFCWTPRGVTQGAGLLYRSVFIEVGSFHPTRNAPLSRRTQSSTSPRGERIFPRSGLVSASGRIKRQGRHVTTLSDNIHAGPPCYTGTRTNQSRAR